MKFVIDIMGSPYHVSGVTPRLFPSDKASAEYKALSVIAESLEHPQRTILSTFVRQAVDREIASEFFLDKISCRNKVTIQEFLADWIRLLQNVRPVSCKELEEPVRQSIWQRDGGQCCISKVQVENHSNKDSPYVYILSPSLFEDGDMVTDGRLYKLLSAYIGKLQLENVRSLMGHESPSSVQDLSSQLVLLSPQIFEHFKNGRLSLQRSRLSAPEGSAQYLTTINNFIPANQLELFRHIKLENRATELASLPNAQLLDIHCRFADALAWLEVLEYMKQTCNMPYKSKTGNVGSTNKTARATKRWSHWCLQSVLSTAQLLWTQLPGSVRAFFYKRLASVACRLYGYTGSDRTYRLPFNLYLRMARSNWLSKHQAEFQSLRLVEKHTQIPAPRAIDVLHYSDSSFLLMTGLPGVGIGRMLHIMTDEQLDVVVQDLKAYVAELRQIPNQTNSEFQICNALGGGILDWRIGESQRKELTFRDETEFNQYLTHDLPLDKTAQEQILKSHSVKHEIVFTHADLNMRNILVDENMKISGIVDWECAGWYPEYWEYSKAHFTVRVTARWIADVLDQVFLVYRDELQAEDLLASLVPPW